MVAAWSLGGAWDFRSLVYEHTVMVTVMVMVMVMVTVMVMVMVIVRKSGYSDHVHPLYVNSPAHLTCTTITINSNSSDGEEDLFE